MTESSVLPEGSDGQMVLVTRTRNADGTVMEYPIRGALGNYMITIFSRDKGPGWLDVACKGITCDRQ